MPVGLDPELSRCDLEDTSADRHLHGGARERLRATGEEPLGRGRRQAADVDPGDLGAGGEVVRRAGERQRERDRAQDDQPG